LPKESPGKIVEKSGIIIKEQVGFRESGQCATQVAGLIQAAESRGRSHKNTNLGRWNAEETWVGFIDWAKAYDSVPHEALFRKLSRLGVGNKLLKAIKRLYTDQTQCVSLGDGKYSDRFPYERGCRQGCPLSPLLFNIYINDLLNSCRGVRVPGMRRRLKGLLFADDGVVFGKSKHAVGQEMNKVIRWGKSNGMSVNADKCAIMLVNGLDNQCIGTKKRVTRGVRIPVVGEYKYLGVNIKPKRSADSGRVLTNLEGCSKTRAESAKGALGLITPILHAKEVGYNTKLMALKGKVEPTGLYMSEVWGGNIGRAESINRTMATGVRKIFNLRANDLPERYVFSVGGIESPVFKARARLFNFAKKLGNRSFTSGEMFRNLPSNSTLMKSISVGYKSIEKALAPDDNVDEKHRQKKVLNLMRISTKLGLGLKFGIGERGVAPAEPLLPVIPQGGTGGTIPEMIAGMRASVCPEFSRVLRYHWGMAEYMFMRQFILSMCLKTIVRKGEEEGHKQVEVCGTCGQPYEHGSADIHYILYCTSIESARNDYLDKDQLVEDRYVMWRDYNIGRNDSLEETSTVRRPKIALKVRSSRGTFFTRKRHGVGGKIEGVVP
jgi:hypothetical protein